MGHFPIPRWVSALTSAVGIAFAALGPFAFGFGLEAAGSWFLPVCGLGLVLVVQSALGIRTGALGRAGA